MGSVRQVDHVDIKRMFVTFHVEHSSALGNLPLLENNEATAKRLYERERRNPRQRRRQRVRSVPSAASEKEQVTARLHECLKIHQDPRLHTDGSNREQIMCFVELRTREKCLEPRREDLAVQPKSPDCLFQEHRLAGL